MLDRPRSLRIIDRTPGLVPTLITGVLDGEPHAEIVQAPPGGPLPWWNNIRRAWMVAGPDGQPVLADPQPPAPLPTQGHDAIESIIPPAVKVTA
jgi:hypothetical protein